MLGDFVCLTLRLKDLADLCLLLLPYFCLCSVFILSFPYKIVFLVSPSTVTSSR